MRALMEEANIQVSLAILMSISNTTVESSPTETTIDLMESDLLTAESTMLETWVTDTTSTRIKHSIDMSTRTIPKEARTLAIVGTVATTHEVVVSTSITTQVIIRIDLTKEPLGQAAQFRTSTIQVIKAVTWAIMVVTRTTILSTVLETVGCTNILHSSITWNRRHHR